MNNVRKRRRHRRRLNPEFVRAWSILLMFAGLITCAIIFTVNLHRTSDAVADEGIHAASPSPITGAYVASLDYNADGEADASKTADVEDADRVVNPEQVLADVQLTVPQGSLYNLSWLAKYKEQVQSAVFAYEYSGQREPERLTQMRKAYGTMYYLVYVATSDLANESIPMMLAKTSTAESGVLDDIHAFSTASAEHAAVDWCILNRVNYDYPNLFSHGDNKDFADAITKITKAQYQFAYRVSQEPYEGHEQLAVDVLIRWCLEGYGLLEDVGRTLPVSYKWFHAAGDGWHNRYRTTYDGGWNCEYWYWTLPDPYKA